ncbi:MAG: DMT family transporter, partial [Campylobacterales bacterium]|nr:DMT family transporter [Campylobacterales bacterium]
MNIPLPFLMILAMMLWGGGWPALKILTESVSWEVATFWRFALMSIAFLPVLWWHRKPISLSVRALGWVGFSGFLNAVFMALSFWGVAVGTAGAGGVVITTLSPVLTVLIAVAVLGMKPELRHIAGLVIGLIGGAVMVQVWDGEVLLHGGNLIFVACALVWAALTLSAQRSHLHLDPIHYTFFLGLIATVFMAFIAYPHGIGSVFGQNMRFWGALVYLAVLGQTVASTIYFIASGKMGSGRASSYMFLVPVCALAS